MFALLQGNLLGNFLGCFTDVSLNDVLNHLVAVKECLEHVLITTCFNLVALLVRFTVVLRIPPSVPADGEFPLGVVYLPPAPTDSGVPLAVTHLPTTVHEGVRPGVAPFHVPFASTHEVVAPALAIGNEVFPDVARASLSVGVECPLAVSSRTGGGPLVSPFAGGELRAAWLDGRSAAARRSAAYLSSL